MGGAGQFIKQIGSTLPFPATRRERETTGDPRESIEERYQSREDYLDRVAAAAQVLADQRYLLAEDLAQILEQAARRYDLFSQGGLVTSPQAGVIAGDD